MSLISFGDCLIPEANIETMRYQKRATEWVWVVRLKDRETPLIDTDAPSVVSVTPNTSSVRMLVVSLYAPDSVPTHGVRELPIVAWRTATSVPNDVDPVTDTAPIAPEYLSRNQAWCYFDPTTGEYWAEADFSVATREAAIDLMLEDLRERQAHALKRYAEASA